MPNTQHHPLPAKSSLQRHTLAQPKRTGAVTIILLIFACISLWYSQVVPPFEAPDELYHYAFTRHLAQGNPLPIQESVRTGPWEQEGSQAPLYYFLIGRLTAGIDQSDFSQINTINPRANLGDPLYPGNKNYMLYSTVTRPLTGANLALHLGRWFSVALGCLTLLLIYGLARLAFPNSTLLPLYTMSLVAAIPQFAFISATVNNDNLIILLSAAVLNWLARIVVKNPTDAVGGWEWGILGLLLGLAALSKLHGLGLIGLAVGVILMRAIQRRQWRSAELPLATIFLTVIMVAGWWYWRNFTLYGDWLGVQHLISVNGQRTAFPTWAGLVGELRGLRYSFWGLFGWFSILMPGWIYPLLDSITLLALVGAVLAYGRGWLSSSGQARIRPAVRVHLLAIMWTLLSLGLIGYWIAIAQGSQGRLFFPAIGSFALLLTFGLGYWGHFLPKRWMTMGLALLPVGLIACSLYALTVLLPTSYRASPPLDEVPSSAQHLGKIYGDALELVAINLPEGRFKPGETVPITLYLRALAPQLQNSELFVQLLTQDNLPIGNITTHPGWGRNPTTLWQPNAIYADTYLVPAWDNISNRSPSIAKVYVGFAHAQTADLLPVQGNSSDLDNRTVGTVQVDLPAPLDLQQLSLRQADIRFGPAEGDVMRLTGYTLPAQPAIARGKPITVTLLWQGTGIPSGDYTAFVHLNARDGTYLAGYDQPPAEGRFPTSLWRPGDSSLSDFTITLPPDLAPGSYDLWTGLYDPASPTFARLPITASDHPTQDNRVWLGTVVLP